MLESYVAYALGPELAWALVLLATIRRIARNKPPTISGNRQLASLGYFLPMLGLLLSFLTVAWLPTSPWWWLLRIALVSMAGVFAVVNKVCSGIDYQDSRNSGVGTLFILFIGLGFLELAIGIAITAFFLTTRYAFLPFLQWGLIGAGTLALLWRLLVWVASFGEKKRP